MRISDWSSDVCSSDLLTGGSFERRWDYTMESIAVMKGLWTEDSFTFEGEFFKFPPVRSGPRPLTEPHPPIWLGGFNDAVRSEEHTSELQSLMRISYAVFCLKKNMSTVHYM